jgi:hypothetical protein
VDRTYGTKPREIKRLWKEDKTDSAGFSALCRLHAYRVTKEKRKENRKWKYIPLECSCGDIFQFRDHWDCELTKSKITEPEEALIRKALGQWNGMGTQNRRKELADNARKVLKKLVGKDSSGDDIGE